MDIDTIEGLHTFLNTPSKINKRTVTYDRPEVERWLHKLLSMAKFRGAEIEQCKDDDSGSNNQE